jgi:hypothetical protein
MRARARGRYTRLRARAHAQRRAWCGKHGVWARGMSWFRVQAAGGAPPLGHTQKKPYLRVSIASMKYLQICHRAPRAHAAMRCATCRVFNRLQAVHSPLTTGRGGSLRVRAVRPHGKARTCRRIGAQHRYNCRQQLLCVAVYLVT